MKTGILILISTLCVSGLFISTRCFAGGTPDRDEDVLFDECEEQIFGTSPTISDTDKDGIPDGDEDHNEDGLTNLEEQNNIVGLRDAISNGDTERVIKLLDYYPYIPTVDDYHLTALALASGSGSTEIVQILLKAGADVNVRDDYGTTALMRATVNGNLAILKLLLKAGADVNAKNKDGETALMYAAANPGLRFRPIKMGPFYHEDLAQTMIVIAKDLIAASADVNASNNNGETALMNAVQIRWIEQTLMVKTLLKAGADVNVRDNNNSTALNYARDNNHMEIFKLLIEAGAEE